MEIRLDEVLAEMEMVNHKNEPQPFEIEYWTCSLSNETGGELKHIKTAVLSRKVKSIKRLSPGSTGKKKRNDFQNMRRNLIDLDADTRQFSNVHIRLIHSFNGRRVVW